MLYLTLPVFSTHDTHYFHWVVLILLALFKKRSLEKDKVFRCTCYFGINYLFLQNFIAQKLIYNIMNILLLLYCIYNISAFLIRHNEFGLLRHTVHEDTCVKNHKIIYTFHLLIYHLYI